MDFSPAFLAGQPYGSVAGTVTVGKASASFTGLFRLPFVFPDDPSNTAYYLSFAGLQPIGVVPVSADERALGVSTVKFEICVGLGSC